MHILLPTDGSELSALATNRGLQFTKTLNGRVTCLFVGNSTYASSIDGTVAHVEDDARAKAELARVRIQAEALGMECECVFVAKGTPKDEIIRVATERRCDMIVMGTRGRSKLGKFFLGSVAASVLADCDIPVMLYR